MISLIQRLKTRRNYPVTMGDVQVHARALTIGELKRMEKVQGELKTALMVAMSIVDENGTSVLTKNESETDEEFAKRAQVELLDDMPVENLTDITNAIRKIGKVPETEAIVKN